METRRSLGDIIVDPDIPRIDKLRIVKSQVRINNTIKDGMLYYTYNGKFFEMTQTTYDELVDELNKLEIELATKEEIKEYFSG